MMGKTTAHFAPAAPLTSVAPPASMGRLAGASMVGTTLE